MDNPEGTEEKDIRIKEIIQEIEEYEQSARARAEGRLPEEGGGYPRPSEFSPSTSGSRQEWDMDSPRVLLDLDTSSVIRNGLCIAMNPRITDIEIDEQPLSYRSGMDVDMSISSPSRDYRYGSVSPSDGYEESSARGEPSAGSIAGPSEVAIAEPSAGPNAGPSEVATPGPSAGPIAGSSGVARAGRIASCSYIAKAGPSARSIAGSSLSRIARAKSRAVPIVGLTAGPSGVARAGPSAGPSDQPYIDIIEPPYPYSRFRYDSDTTAPTVVVGANTTNKHRTWPTICIRNHSGRATLTVSLVTKDEPFRYTLHSFHNLYKDAPRLMSLDGWGTNGDDGYFCRCRSAGFEHREHATLIDRHAVRLCFSVELQTNQYVPPKVSEVIYNTKSISDLVIQAHCKCSGNTRGGSEIILVCKQVRRNDLEIVFYEKKNDEVVWEERAGRVTVYKQVAIVCEVPPYTRSIDREKKVFVELRRLSDGMRGIPIIFKYFPHFDEVCLRSKRQKTVNPILKQYADANWKPEHYDPDNQPPYV